MFPYFWLNDNKYRNTNENTAIIYFPQLSQLENAWKEKQQENYTK